MNHREINTKIIELLGWEVCEGIVYLPEVEKFPVYTWDEEWQCILRWDSAESGQMVDFLDGRGMLFLIEEARKQGILIDLQTWNIGYEAIIDYGHNRDTCFNESAPLAATLVFLKYHRIDITPYLEGIGNE